MFVTCFMYLLTCIIHAQRHRYVCCSVVCVLQRGRPWCTVLHCVALCWAICTPRVTAQGCVLQCMCCSVLQFVAVCCSVYRCSRPRIWPAWHGHVAHINVSCHRFSAVRGYCNVLQCVVVCGSVFQCVSECVIPQSWHTYECVMSQVPGSAWVLLKQLTPAPVSSRVASLAALARRLADSLFF